MIETRRLLLRPFGAEDLDIIYRLYSDAEIMRYMPPDRMDWDAAQAHLDRIVRNWQADPPLSRELAVVRKDSGEKIGRARVLWEPEHDAVMIGWMLIQDEWGKGLASEMTRAMVDFCFSQLGVHRVYALCNPDNGASRRVLERCGLRLEARLREKCPYRRKGEILWQDELVYAILASDR